MSKAVDTAENVLSEVTTKIITAGDKLHQFTNKLVVGTQRVQAVKRKLSEIMPRLQVSHLLSFSFAQSVSKLL